MFDLLGLKYIDTVPEIVMFISSMAAVFGVSIELCRPVKLYPLTWLVKKIGSIMNVDMYKRMDCFENELRKVTEKIDRDRIKDKRIVILEFANSCKNGRKHTQNEFDVIFEAIDEYHMLVEKYGVINNKFVTEEQYLREVYLECCKKGNFL